MVKGKFQTYFPFEKDSMTYSCLHCRAHLARHDDLISKSFQGSQGRAYLFNQAVNVRCAEAKQRVLLTGLHFVADIFCACCDTALGWKYERAFEPSQRYKEGKVIIELVHLYKDNSWDAEWLYPLYPATTTTTAMTTSTTANTTTSTNTKVTPISCKKSHSVTISDYNNYETGGKLQSSLRSSQIPVCKSLSSTTDAGASAGGIFESSTTDLINVNDDSYTNFAHHHHQHHEHQHQHEHHHHSHSHSHHPTPHNHNHHHHHKHHYHSNSSSISSSTSTSTSSSPSSSSSVHTQQSSYTSLMPNDLLSYRLSSSLNATGWAFRIPPTTTTSSSSNKGGSHSCYNSSGSGSGNGNNRNTCLLDLSDSGRVSDYHRNSASISITDNNNSTSNMGHLNPVCSIDNNHNNSNNDDNNSNNNNDSGVENNDNVTSDSVYTTATDNSCNPNNNNNNNNKANNNNNGNQIIIMNDNDNNKNYTRHEKFKKSKSLTPLNVKLFPEGQSNIITNISPTTGNNNNSGSTSGYSRFDGKSSEISSIDITNGNGNNRRIPMDDICLRKLSQFSTPQARRISKINPSNLRVTITSSLGKRSRKRSRHRRRASSASPSRDFLLPTGSDDEETDDIPELTEFSHQSHNVVQVQQ